MKKMNNPLLNILMFLVFALPLQCVFAGTVEVPLKKGDDGTGGMPGNNVMAMSLSRTASVASFSVVPVSVALYDTELAVDFSKYVGIVTITGVDQFGGVAFQETINTRFTTESSVETGGWDSGSYTIYISYGTTKYNGSFQL
jgi:hypothetical protein